MTELLDGDLEKLLQKKDSRGSYVHPLTLFERMDMAKQAALGLNWLHNQDNAIIHRDLKTANLMYKRHGNSYVVKVGDFGLAAIKPKHIKNLREKSKGTPLYMAPEVVALVSSFLSLSESAFLLPGDGRTPV